MTGKATRPVLNYQRPALVSLLAIAVLIGGGLAWSQSAKVAGAVIASGSIVVQGKPKSVQHLDGGIVKAIHVDRGDSVLPGDVLIELDETTITANLEIYRGRLRDALVRRARLTAELNGRDTFEPSQRSIDLASDKDLAEVLKQQRLLMSARRATREAQIAQFEEKVAQFTNQIAGIKKLIEFKTKQLASFKTEWTSVAALVKKGFSTQSRELAIVRSMDDTLGQIAEHESEIARISNSIAETRLSRLQLDLEFREKAVTEIEEQETKINELGQQLIATEKQLERVVIRAPVAGTIHELSVFTIGGVIKPGETIMQVIPQTDSHEIELSVDTRSVDQVYPDQAVTVRFPAFHQRSTPELKGAVSSVSPSSIVDERTGAAFYRVVVEISDEELNRLKDKQLVPGMPVEGFIQTEARTVLSYITKPLIDNLEHVFREE